MEIFSSIIIWEVVHLSAHLLKPIFLPGGTPMEKRKVELSFDTEAGIPDAVVTVRPINGQTEMPVRVFVVGEGEELLAEELLEEVKQQLAVDGVYVMTSLKIPEGASKWISTTH